jgi:hypothetical protein
MRWPGVHVGLSEALYHSDPALSSTGARWLLRCPAMYQWRSTHSVHSDTFDLGKAAHARLLKAGPGVVVVDAPTWQTKAARQARDEARGAGLVPLLADVDEQVTAMAEAARLDPLIRMIFDGPGVAEQSLFWKHRSGLMCRARPDWTCTGRTKLLVDYKTTKSAAPDDLPAAIARYGYHQQAAWYLDGAAALAVVPPDASFLFVFQEVTPPYLTNVVQLADDAIMVGRRQNEQAVGVYHRCLETGVWPGYTSGRAGIVSLPSWYMKEAAI